MFPEFWDSLTIAIEDMIRGAVAVRPDPASAFTGGATAGPSTSVFGGLGGREAAVLSGSACSTERWREDGVPRCSGSGGLETESLGVIVMACRTRTEGRRLSGVDVR